MEPKDLKSDSPDDAPIEAWLRARATLAPLPDDGFSTRVLAALPPAARSMKPALRPWLCAAGAIVGCVLAASSGLTAPAAVDQVAALASALQTALTPLADPSFGLALVVTGVSLAFVYWRELTSKLVR